MENENISQNTTANEVINIVDQKQQPTLIIKIIWAAFIILGVVAILVESVTPLNPFYLTIALSSTVGVISILYRIFLIVSLFGLYFLIKRKLLDHNIFIYFVIGFILIILAIVPTFNGLFVEQDKETFYKETAKTVLIQDCQSNYSIEKNDTSASWIYFYNVPNPKSTSTIIMEFNYPVTAAEAYKCKSTVHVCDKDGNCSDDMKDLITKEEALSIEKEFNIKYLEKDRAVVKMENNDNKTDFYALRNSFMYSYMKYIEENKLTVNDEVKLNQGYTYLRSSSTLPKFSNSTNYIGKKTADLFKSGNAVAKESFYLEKSHDKGFYDYINNYLNRNGPDKLLYYINNNLAEYPSDISKFIESRSATVEVCNRYNNNRGCQKYTFRCPYFLERDISEDVEVKSCATISQ